MKIRKIILDNIQCFKHIEIELSTNENVNDWLVLLGDNGVGKTTLLRSIALGLCEESGATGLLDELATDWIRKENQNDPAKIRIEFNRIDNYEDPPFIETTIKKTKFDEIELIQTIHPENLNIWDNLFICGYGANRRSYGTTSYNQYTVTDAIYSMFNYSTSMQNIELNFRRIEKEIDLEEIFRKIEDILMLEKYAFKMLRNGVHVIGPWGSYVPMGALGDGYQATIAWIMDMYGWKLLYEKKLKNANISGIVFLDEIEQHLHPKWQTEIVKRLSNQFEDIQFIISTHSPLVALNSFSGNFNNFNSKLFVLNWVKDHVNISEIDEPLSDLDYDQLLGSEAFGHLYNLDTEVNSMLREMSQLAAIDKPNKNQVLKLNNIKQELENLMFPEGKTLIERNVERDYWQEKMKKNKEIREMLRGVKFDKD